MTSQAHKKQISSLISQIHNYVADENLSGVLDQVSAGFALDKKYMLAQLKKSGLLRHSKYLSRQNIVPVIARHLLKQKEEYCFTKQEINYFSSLIQFESFYIEMRRIDQFITTELAQFKGKGRLKAILAKNDVNFLLSKSADRARGDLSEYTYYNKEEICEGVSFLVSRYTESSGITDEDIDDFDTDYVISPAIEQLLAEAARFKAFLELEIEIESFGFICIKKNEEYWIDHPDHDFIKTLEISNILYAMRSATNIHACERKYADVPSYMEVFADIYVKTPGILIQQQYPSPKLILSAPASLYQHFLDGEMRFMREEFAIIEAFQRELLIQYDQLKDYELKDGLTFFDLLKMHRYFMLQYHLFSFGAFREIGKVDNLVIYNSVVTTSDRESLINTLATFTDDKKARLFVDTLTWRTGDTDKFLDLQYRPLIACHNRLCISNSTLGVSNLLRNIFPSESRVDNNFKIKQQSKHTSIPASLKTVFGEKNFVTYQEVNISVKGTNQSNGDIDFFAYRDGLLFIAECKDCVYPTDLFELRTTYNHILKAASQLDYIMEAINTPAFNEHLCNRIGIPVGSIKKVVSAIVMSNAKFWGYQIGNHAIRDIALITGFVSTGHRHMSLEDGKITTFKTWKTDKFTNDDLVRFLSNKGPQKATFDACKERVYKYGPGHFKKTYVLSLSEVYDNLKRQYRYVTKKL